MHHHHLLPDFILALSAFISSKRSDSLVHQPSVAYSFSAKGGAIYAEILTDLVLCGQSQQLCIDRCISHPMLWIQYFILLPIGQLFLPTAFLQCSFSLEINANPWRKFPGRLSWFLCSMSNRSDVFNMRSCHRFFLVFTCYIFAKETTLEYI